MTPAEARILPVLRRQLMGWEIDDAGILAAWGRRSESQAEDVLSWIVELRKSLKRKERPA